MARCMEIEPIHISGRTLIQSFHECTLDLYHWGRHMCWCDMAFGRERGWSDNDVIARELTPEQARAMEARRRPDRRRDPAEQNPEGPDAPG